MTEGGPAQDTTVLALLLWQRTYVFLDSPQAWRGGGDGRDHVGGTDRRVLPIPQAHAGSRSEMNEIVSRRRSVWLLYGAATTLSLLGAGALRGRRDDLLRADQPDAS